MITSKYLLNRKVKNLIKNEDLQGLDTYITEQGVSAKQAVTKYVAKQIIRGNNFTQYSKLDNYMLKQADFGNNEYIKKGSIRSRIAKSLASILMGIGGYTIGGPIGALAGISIANVRKARCEFEKQDYTSKQLSDVIKNKKFRKKRFKRALLGGALSIFGTMAFTPFGALVSAVPSYLMPLGTINYKFKKPE